MKQMIYKPNREIEILDEGYMGCLHYCIVSLGTHPCAYIELPKEHKYYGKHYGDIDIWCHGGLTYASEYGLLPKDDTNHKDGFWIGWDYSHLGDYAGYEEMFPKELRTGGKRWTTEEILVEVKDAAWQLLQTEEENER
jgi:hypothetical protein